MDAGAGAALALLLVGGGLAGLLASWVITIDELKLLADPNFTPGCSMNPVVSCGNIMKSDQATVFGFPNPLLGLVAYAVVTLVGVALLAGATLRRWFWLGLNSGALLGVLFCTWLQYQSLYSINSLCLWCCLAWAATIVVFWSVTAHNVRSGMLFRASAPRAFFDELALVPPLLHVGIIAMLILTRWWDFWTSSHS
ncbi:vitamin K epoxide reductase family protein [Streptomyces sp. NPDC050738]|uniref:vitamin K epoxide reductase family protein n=1 Tax=Streptomyces sp. NPDC050738 TaxID=3154744 RepID=UPI00343F1B26